MCRSRLLFCCCDQKQLSGLSDQIQWLSDRNQLRGQKEGFNLTFPGHSPSLRQVGAGRQAGTEAQPVRMLLTAWLPGSCSTCFLMEPGPPCLGMIPPTVGWVFPHPSSSVKTMSHRHGHRPNWHRQFFKRGRLFSGGFRLWQVDNKIFEQHRWETWAPFSVLCPLLYSPTLQTKQRDSDSFHYSLTLFLGWGLHSKAATGFGLFCIWLS